MTPNDLVTTLRPLLAAECAAEAPAAGIDAADLEQAVWVRLLSDRTESGPTGRRTRPRRPEPPALRLRAAVRAEARAASRLARREVPYDPVAAEPADHAGALDSGVERAVLAAESRRELRAAVRRLPGRCPGLMRALLSSGDPTYREIAGELGISQGSLGPIRSRCLGCLRRMLTAAIAAPGPWGKER
ncbi:RNA polymerase sigma factor [Streptomyces sp. URMC 126]|uniref:RNA polymerase sigma factor n=1 Tax=Streptomyces sp. URMC 126 TaxID=3423401 RepID=UPI003F1CA34B